ncbi:hypothetical protein SHKM778_07220 [Streptomyces sp. KM77-8]|uniref:Uncharacterized protein n=1 Tax=Streptomyces haneummycinicus TaxID=3074435 RepID=A0AAT9HA81_9ACTN
MATAPADASPIEVSSGTPATDSPASAMTTVAPAKTTALPAVALARATDSTTGIPAASWPRWRDTMNRA